MGHEKDDSEAFGLSNGVSIVAVYSDGEHRGKNKLMGGRRGKPRVLYKTFGF